MLFSSPSLLIKPTYLLFFLNPTAEVPQNATIVDGDVVLQLPSAKKIRHIDVELIGKQAMRMNGRHVSYQTLHLTTTIESGLMEAGAHAFRFSFVVPGNTAPKERLGEKQVHLKRHNNIAPHGGHCWAVQTHLLKVTVKGVGSPFGGDLVAEHNLVLHAVHQDGPPAGLNRREVCRCSCV